MEGNPVNWNISLTGGEENKQMIAGVVVSETARAQTEGSNTLGVADPS